MTTFAYRTRTTIGYWNVKTLRDKDNIDEALNSKYLQVEREMSRYGLSILGLSEIRWLGSGEFTSPISQTTMLYSGKDIGCNHESGVGLMLTKTARKSLIDWKPVSDRILLARFASKVRNIAIIQCYAPTEIAKDDAKNSFYGQLNSTYDSVPRGDIIIVMGDMNAKVGSDNESLRHIMGKHGIGTRNDNGERFIDFCNSRKLVIGGTLFEHKVCHKTTWLSPDRRNTANQIDHCAISHRYRKCLLDVRSKRGADIGQSRDHYLVVAKVRLCTAAIQRKIENLRPKRYDVGRLDNTIVRENFITQLRNAITTTENVSQSSVNSKWHHIRNTIRSCADRTLGPTPKGRQEWMTDETWNIVTERRMIKEQLGAMEDSGGKVILETNYRNMHKLVQRSVRRDKRRRIDCLAEEAEKAAQAGDTRTVYKITKQLVDRNLHAEHPVRDLQGNLLNTDHEQLQRWREHFCRVLNCVIDPSLQPPILTDLPGNINQRLRITPPSIMEIIAAIKQLPNGKAAGTDGIPAEIYKCDPTLSAQILHPLIAETWETESFPEEWKDGIIVKIAKKGDLKNCSNWRGICVLPTVAKIVAKIILNRIKEQLEQTISSCQAGFRSGSSCVDHINSLRIIIEQCVEFNSKLYMLFIDFEKAFDSINRDCIWLALRRRNIPEKYIAIIKESYNHARCFVLHKGKLSAPFMVESGVRQGCILSPLLFLIVMEDVLNNIENKKQGIQWKINNSYLNYLAYADDICLLSHKLSDLKQTTKELQEKLQYTGLKINSSKTKTLSIGSATEPITINNDTFDATDKFCYLGCEITADGGTEADVGARINKARTSFGMLAPIWQSNKISQRTKLRIFESNVKSVLLYGCTTWKVTNNITKRIQTFINRCLRRILRIFWPQTISNTELLARTTQMPVATEIRKRKWQWIGHTLRRNDDNISKQALRWNPFHQYGRVSGRPRITWRRSTESEMNQLGVSWNELGAIAENRVRWRTAVIGALCSSGS